MKITKLSMITSAVIAATLSASAVAGHHEEKISMGFNAAIDGQIQRRDNNIEHTLSWQWQQGESSTGETIADLPPPSVRYATAWRRSHYALGMDLRYRFSRNRSGPGEIALGSAAILGVSAEWMINPEWTVKTSITNGLNKNYRTSATQQAPFDMGRAINVKIDWRP